MATPVEEACKAVEAASGKPVIVQSDPHLKLIATVSIARGSAPAHVVSFNPRYGEATNYHIVFQCGYTLRIYQTPASDRFDVGSTDEGRRDAGSLVELHLQKSGISLPAAARSEFRDQLYNGLILQLRSIPIGFRVDEWVREFAPTLIEQQQQSAVRQLAEYQATLSPQVKAIAPEKIFRASAGMNAAFALFWSRILGDPTVTVPYKVSGLLPLGEKLLAVADSLPRDPGSDRDLIHKWGELLGINGWYSFIPFGG